MKPKSFIKVLYGIIWTGIFLLSSIIIVKGSSLVSEDMEEKVNEYFNYIGKKMVVCALNNSSPFLCYSRAEINMPQKTLGEYFMESNSFLSYLAVENSLDTMLECDNDALDISSMISETNRSKENGTPIIIEEQKDSSKAYLKSDSNKYSEISNQSVKQNESMKLVLDEIKKTNDSSLLLKSLYTVDSTTSVDKSLFQVDKMLNRDFSFEKSNKPQILIFHTHGASESFSDSREGKMEDSIIGVGEHLKEILENDYGYVVIHDKTPYDKVDGKIDRNKAYNKSLEGVSKILKENPSIEVVIDLHRDGVGNSKKKLTTIHGKPTAQFMIFNGLSRNRVGEIAYLNNPNLEGNLSFGLQMKWKAMELYPNLTVSNYLKGYRYNMHLKERYLLIELGNQNNTVEEAKNTMQPLAEVLTEVIKKGDI